MPKRPNARVRVRVDTDLVPVIASAAQRNSRTFPAEINHRLREHYLPMPKSPRTKISIQPA